MMTFSQHYLWTTPYTIDIVDQSRIRRFRRNRREERYEERMRRDPILPAPPSASLQQKKRSHQTAEGLPVHSFEGLLSALASRARVAYALKSEKAEEKASLTFQQVPEPTPVQARAYELVRMFPVTGR